MRARPRVTCLPVKCCDRVGMAGSRIYRRRRVARGIRNARPTRSFPFRNGEGLFLIQAHIEGLGLDYQPGWTQQVLDVDAEFRNVGMTAQLRKAK